MTAEKCGFWSKFLDVGRGENDADVLRCNFDTPFLDGRNTLRILGITPAMDARGQPANGLQTDPHNISINGAGREAEVSATNPAMINYKKLEITTASGNLLWSIPLSSLAATRELPVFSSSRRPPPTLQVPKSKPSIAPAAQEPARPLVALIGAISGHTEGIAIFIDETTKGIVRLKTGESYSRLDTANGQSTRGYPAKRQGYSHPRSSHSVRKMKAPCDHEFIAHPSSRVWTNSCP